MTLKKDLIFDSHNINKNGTCTFVTASWTKVETVILTAASSTGVSSGFWFKQNNIEPA